MQHFFLFAACLCVLIFPLHTFAQDVAEENGGFLRGTIIKLDGDTIKGFTQIRDHAYNTGSCVFKEHESDVAVTYKPNDITGYTVADQNVYRSVSADSTGVAKFFAECLVAGRSSLFYYRERYFIQSSSLQMVELISRQNVTFQNGMDYTVELPVYKGTLQESMNDCGVIHETIKTTKLEKKSLTKLFVQYNKCVGIDAKVFEGVQEKSEVRFGFSLGVLASSLKLSPGAQSNYSYVDRQPSPTDLTIAPSLWLQVSSPKRRIQLRTGITLYSGQYHIYDENENANQNHDLTIKATRIEVPVQLKYNLLRGRAGLYVLGGIGLNVMVQWDDREVVTTSSGFELSNNSDLDPNNFMINVLGGLNFEVPVGRHAFFLETVYGWNPLLIKSTLNSPTGTINALRFGAGFYFRDTPSVSRGTPSFPS